MSDAIDRVAKIMFGIQDNQTLLSFSMGQMVFGYPPGSEIPRGFNYQEVLKLCMIEGDPMIVAKVITAGTALNPVHAHHWIGEIERLFELQDSHSLIADANPQFVFGLVLGLFQAQVWLDDYSWPRTHFEERLPRLLCTIAFCIHPTTETILGSPQCEGYPSKQYQAVLSQVVKAWVRPRKPVAGNVGRRLAQVKQLLEMADETYGHWDEKRGDIPKLASLILDQVAYAHFGGISTQGRVQALSLMHRHLFQHLMDQQAHRD